MHRSMLILTEIRTYHACAGFEVFEGAIKAVSMLFIPELFSLVVIAIIFRCFWESLAPGEIILLEIKLKLLVSLLRKFNSERNQITRN